MKLIVGLVNHGKQYENTRHNIGFMVVDNYILREGISENWKSKFNGLYLETNIKGEKVIFVKPQSYMNLSGGVVSQFVNFYKINIDDILVISDDLDLLTGNYKLKSQGSCGGHNGLRDIERCLGTQAYKRLKVGISKDNDIDTKDYVLGKISKDDMKIYEDLFTTFKTVIDDFFNMSFSDLMNKHNSKNR
jgi:PTH1 family peptidyl-tRNA hydrolase